MNTRKIMTAFAILSVAALALSTVPASASSFALHFGGPVRFMGDNDMPKLGEPEVQFEVRLGGPDVSEGDDVPSLPPMTKADYEQAKHQCEVVKKIKVLLEEMDQTLQGYYRIGDKVGANAQLELIHYWKGRLEITKRECYKIYV